MKKSKLSVGLVTSFIGALALSACGTEAKPVVDIPNTITTLVGYNEGTDRIVINTDLYNEYKKTSEGREKFYNAILETLIRYEYPLISAREGSTLKKYETLLLDAQGKVNAAMQTAQDTADANGTTLEEEWEKVLESHDCETTEDLKQKYLFDLEKEAIGDWYFKQNQESLKKHYLGVSEDWEPVEKENGLSAVYPYHIQHVLVTLSAAKDDYNRGTITTGEATKLWSVLRQLIDKSYSFEDVAKLSDDPGSKDKGGDVGIMSTKTSFYAEFKLGIYAYETVLSGVNSYVEPETEKTKGAREKATSDIYKAMGLYQEVYDVAEEEYITRPAKLATAQGESEETVEQLIKKEMSSNLKVAQATEGFKGNIPTVPYEVFKRISDLSEDGDKIGTFSPESGDVALPRNVLYNQFLNFHSPFLITNQDISITDSEGKATAEDKLVITKHDFKDNKEGNLYIPENNFVEADMLGIKGIPSGVKVLTDGRNSPLVCVRSESGIHFMSMRKSVFYNTNRESAIPETTRMIDTKANTSLEDYYTTLVPSDEDFPSNGDTYVYMKKTDDEAYYRDRANEIKDELKKTDVYDPAYNYRLYETLLLDQDVLNKIEFFDGTSANSQIKKEIEEYINSLRLNKKISDAEEMNSAWASYINLLAKQNWDRHYDDSLVPTTCAFHFNEANKSAFEEDGICYVTSK
ncbi:MAG: peptidylprolyl isomerase [Bacilli bacterium]|nr:peptidylprolyl isomerase [Bacilli bacterium]